LSGRRARDATAREDRHLNFKIIDRFPDSVLESAWRDCLANSDDASHYASPEYFVEPFFRGRRLFAVLAMEGSRVDGVLTGMSSGSGAECGLSVRPQICRRRTADADRVGEALAAGIEALDHGRHDLLTVYSWERIPAFERHGFKLRESTGAAGIVVLDLMIGPEAIFKQFSDTRRNQIRRAMRAGVSVTEMSIEADFDDYYSIYRNWCEFKGLPTQPYELQRSALSSNNRLVLVARSEDRIIGASIFRFQPGGLMEYGANVSRREDTKVRPNDLLVWRAIEWGCRRGFKTLSMGGAHLFLQMFGGRQLPTYRYRLDRSLFRRHELYEGMRAALAGLWRRLPGFIQERIRRAAAGATESRRAD
jgi:hypothetical protein